MADWAGKELGDYRLDAALAPEHYGARYRANAVSTGATVEVRVIAPPTADDRWFADRVASTLRRYDGVSAPGLAPLLAVGTAEGAVYTVGPVLAGKTLRSRLGAPLPLAEVVDLLTPIARALDALHARYLPHGGVRPEAIVLDPAGSLLRDAGVAPAIAAAFRLAALAASTPPLAERGYRAPEAGSGSVDPRADIYSLAAVAYEALTGRPPFTAADAGADAERLAVPHRDTPPPAPRTLIPAISPATEAALLRGLAKYPFERPERAGAFLDLLRESAAGASAAPPPTFASPPAAWMQATPTPAPVPAPQATATTPLTPPVVTPPLAPEPYEYRSPESTSYGGPLTERVTRDLPAGRTALVTTLAALANRRGALATERQQVVGVLRAVESARGQDQRLSSDARARAQQSGGRRPTPTARADRHATRNRAARDDWSEVYAVPTETAIPLAIRAAFSAIFTGVIVALFSHSTTLAVLVIIGGALYGLYTMRVATRTTIVCRPDGFVVSDNLFPWQRQDRYHRWSDVTRLRYEEQLTGKGEAARAIGIFIIEVNGQIAATVSDRYPGFDLRGIIQRFGRETPQLPSVWVYNEQAPLAASGHPVDRYTQVSRGALRAGVN